ncbi:unnamed protein product [Ixodes pacificus]
MHLEAKLEDKKRRACEHLQCGRRMGDIWVQCFACCVTEQPAPKRRRRIDRSMIGNPTNFQHTAHVGSGDMSVHLNALQNQMASKGGYDNDTRAALAAFWLPRWKGRPACWSVDARDAEPVDQSPRPASRRAPPGRRIGSSSLAKRLPRMRGRLLSECTGTSQMDWDGRRRSCRLCVLAPRPLAPAERRCVQIGCADGLTNPSPSRFPFKRKSFYRLDEHLCT